MLLVPQKRSHRFRVVSRPVTGTRIRQGCPGDCSGLHEIPREQRDPRFQRPAMEQVREFLVKAPARHKGGMYSLTGNIGKFLVFLNESGRTALDTRVLPYTPAPFAVKGAAMLHGRGIRGTGVRCRHGNADWKAGPCHHETRRLDGSRGGRHYRPPSGGL